MSVGRVVLAHDSTDERCDFHRWLFGLFILSDFGTFLEFLREAR